MEDDLHMLQDYLWIMEDDLYPSAITMTMSLLDVFLGRVV